MSKKQKQSPRKAPAYRQRKGYDQAIVTLSDAVTKERRDYWLGTHGTPESWQLYYRLLSQWEANGRRLPDPPEPEQSDACDATGITISQMVHAYWQWAKAIGYSQGEWSKLKVVCRLLRQFYGSTPAAAFGPKKMRLLREEMVRGNPNETPPRERWARPYINAQVRRIRSVFKWAAGQELIPAAVHDQLRMMEPLKRGRTPAHEPAPVEPVAMELVEAVKPYVSRQVWALIKLQLHTGARGGELCCLRPIDLQIDEAAGVWTHTPAEHKTAHHGKRRTIYFGPEAQKVLGPFLENRPVNAYLFSPAEAEAERREKRLAARTTPISCGNRAGTNRTDDPQWSPNDHYTPASYGRAIQYACDKAFPPPEELARQMVPPRGRKQNVLRRETDVEWKKRLGPDRWEELRAWRREHRWHPHQLRHSAATFIRREFGLEAAQLVLGHSSALVTDAIYAERDAAKVIDVVKRVG